MLVVSADKDTNRIVFASQTSVYVYAMNNKDFIFIQSFESESFVSQIAINSQTIILTHTRI